MWREKSRRGLGILAVVVGIVSAAACSGGGYGSTPTAPNPAPPGSPAADVTITIRGMLGAQSFDPNPGSVKAGQTVAWYNADSIPHNPTGSGFDTGLLNPGQTSRSVTLAAAGNVSYHCAIHPEMVGALSVTQ
jgi:plastocyanin